MPAQTQAARGRHRAAGVSSHDAATRRDRALISSAGASLLARLITALGSLLSVALAARSLTAPQLGVVAVLTTLVVFLGFGDLGLGAMLMTRLPAAHARNDVPEMRRLVTSVTGALILVSSAVAVLGTLSVFVVPWRAALGARALSTTDLRWSLLAFLWTGAVGIVATVGTRLLLAMQRGALIRTLNAAATVVSVGAVAVCAAVHGPMWSYVLSISAPTTFIGLFELLWATCVLYPELAFDRAAFTFAESLRCLATGTGYAVLSLGWVVAYTLDSIVVSSVLGAASAAVFSVAARLFNLVGGTLQVAGQQMWPAISDALARGEIAWVRRRFRHSLLIAATTSTAGCLVLVVAGRALARIWVGAELVPPLSLFLAFSAWTIYMTVMTQYSYLLFAWDRIRTLAYLGLLIAGVNLTASILLTRATGLSGPVLGNLVAAGLVQLVPTVVMSRRLARELGIARGEAAPAGTPEAARSPAAHIPRVDPPMTGLDAFPGPDGREP